MRNSVLSSFREVSDLSKEEWKEKLENSEVRCKVSMGFYIFITIQLGIKGEILRKYIFCFLKRVIYIFLF